ncbi:MAG TPA: hypothetical protein VFF80_01190 [Bacillota bacterium]|nr:hypothetical protein [Bacillota bacterium]
MGAGIVGYGTKNNTPIDGIQMDLFVKMDLESRMVTKLSYQVHFPVEFSEEQKAMILEKMGHCYVKKHLFTPPEITVSEV